MNVFVYFLVLILSLGYFLYTGQVLMSVSVLGFFLIGVLLLRFVISSKNNIVYNLYTLFFVVYGSLVLFTQIELIGDPYEDFFVHNDAAFSFYSGIMRQVYISDWNSLFSSSFLNLAFADYPLASFLFGAITKIGNDIGIVDLRLFQRIHVSVLGAMTVGVIAEVLCKWKLPLKVIKRLVIPFGLCSYLFITSAIFSRDIHVVFLYTLVGYYMLRSEKQMVLLPLIILALLSAGMRPVNGILVILPISIIVYSRLLKNNPSMAKLTIIITIALIFLYARSMIDYGLGKLAFYEEYMSQNAGTGFFVKIYSLPFPINQICMNIYELLMPIPMGLFILGSGGSLLTIPFILSPFLMSLVWVASLWFICKKFRQQPKLSIYLLCALTLFALINFAAPDIRRSFAAIPMLYMGFCLVYRDIPKNIIKRVKQIAWPSIVAINLFFIFYLYL